ncbi:MAG: hypothetical protein FD169_2529 [Bacillota bacterium]|nr:MAG: hypothetical protein FD169_2529 [Bacillota bacterium]
MEVFAKILAFLLAYGWQLLGVLGVVIWAAYEIITHGLDKFIQGAMLRAQKWAEQQADIRGPELMEMVVSLTMTYVVSHWPAAIRQFVSEEFVRNRAHWLYKTARDILDDGKLNGSYVRLN